MDQHGLFLAVRQRLNWFEHNYVNANELWD